MNKKYTLKKVGKLATTTLTGLALLVQGVSLGGCNPEPEYSNKNSPITKQTHECYMDKTFKKAYNEFTLDKLTDDEKTIFVTTPDIKNMPKEQRKFAEKHLNFIDLTNLNLKNIGYFIHYEDKIKSGIHYENINVKNISPEEKKIIKEFREGYLIKENFSWKIDSSKLNEDDKEFLENIKLFVDPNNISDRDILFMNKIFSGYAALMMF
tara:strand:+ start:1471 stop:2097 length:627 start_codon:yes stop_codon:yes gene_type:complete